MTRAKDRLTLGAPLRFYMTQQTRNGDRHIYAMRTRFIPKEMLGLFETRSWSPPQPAGTRPAPVHRIDVGTQMLSMWD